ncbi:MAG: mechanosensitive ion channel [Chloroflexi bacterium]|nr:mechanosensitive ion channel [Chloroflexota bacterium]
MNGTNDITGILKNLAQADLVQIGLIIGGAVLLLFLVQRVLPWLAGKFFGRIHFLLLTLVPVLRLAIILIGFVLLIPYLIEPTFENLVALLGALGLALGFALKDYVSSLIAGIVALYEMPYHPGDWIKVDGVYGEVRAIKMRVAEIVTPDDTVVIIPHLKLWDQLIFNANDGGQNLQCVTDFYLHPHHDAAQVKHALHDVALTSAFLQLEQPVRVIVVDKPWGTHYRLRAYPIDPRQQFDFVTDLTVRGKAALVALGVTFTTAPAIPAPGD